MILTFFKVRIPRGFRSFVHDMIKFHPLSVKYLHIHTYMLICIWIIHFNPTTRGFSQYEGQLFQIKLNSIINFFSRTYPIWRCQYNVPMFFIIFLKHHYLITIIYIYLFLRLISSGDDANKMCQCFSLYFYSIITLSPLPHLFFS